MESVSAVLAQRAAPMSRICFDGRARLPADLRPPISKSDGVRSLLLRHLLGLPPHPVLSSWPDDMQVMARGLARLASAEDRLIDCREAGSVLRLLLSQAAIDPGRRTRFVGAGRLGARPLEDLVEALRLSHGEAGLRIDTGAPWPLDVVGGGRAEGALFKLRAAASSQFASSLALAAAALFLREGRAWSLELPHLASSGGYFQLTLAWLEAVGFSVEGSPTRVSVTGFAPRGEWPPLPGDWSSAGYLLAMAWPSGVRVVGIRADAAHPDRCIVHHLESVGLVVCDDGPDALRVAGTARGGLRVQVSHAPDCALTLAALACVMPEPSCFTDFETLRAKESDRLQGLVALVAASGGSVRQEGSALWVEPPASPSRRLHFDAQADHRLAMSAATMAVLTGATLELEGADAVAKSFPDFWAQLGVSLPADGAATSPGTSADAAP